MNLQKRNTATLQSRPNSELSILEKPLEWLTDFHEGFLAHLEKTGELDWKKYVHPRNLFAPSGESIQLANSRLMLITSSGAYLPESQETFDQDNRLGDYSIRGIPTDTPFADIKYAHKHYDHKYVDKDPQALIPIRHLEKMEEDGKIGSLTSEYVSFSGYQPNVIRIVKETIPAILKAAKENEVQAALLIPVWPLCIQSVGLIARALEVNNIATTMTSWDSGLARLTAPPRVTVTKLMRGSPLGMPGDSAQQLRVLEATLGLLEQDAPVDVVYLEENSEEE